MNRTKYSYPDNLLNDIFQGYKNILYPQFSTKSWSEEGRHLTDEEMKGLNKQLDSLPLKERTILLFFYKEGKSMAQISKEYNLSVSRIRQILAKSLRMLQHPSRAKYIRNDYWEWTNIRRRTE